MCKKEIRKNLELQSSILIVSKMPDTICIYCEEVKNHRFATNVVKEFLPVLQKLVSMSDKIGHDMLKERICFFDIILQFLRDPSNHSMTNTPLVMVFVDLMTLLIRSFFMDTDYECTVLRYYHSMALMVQKVLNVFAAEEDLDSQRYHLIISIIDWFTKSSYFPSTIHFDSERNFIISNSKKEPLIPVSNTCEILEVEVENTPVSKRQNFHNSLMAESSTEDDYGPFDQYVNEHCICHNGLFHKQKLQFMRAPTPGPFNKYRIVEEQTYETLEIESKEGDFMGKIRVEKGDLDLGPRDISIMDICDSLVKSKPLDKIKDSSKYCDVDSLIRLCELAVTHVNDQKDSSNHLPYLHKNRLNSSTKVCTDCDLDLRVVEQCVASFNPYSTHKMVDLSKICMLLHKCKTALLNKLKDKSVATDCLKKLTDFDDASSKTLISDKAHVLSKLNLESKKLDIMPASKQKCTESNSIEPTKSLCCEKPVERSFKNLRRSERLKKRSLISKNSEKCSTKCSNTRLKKRKVKTTDENLDLHAGIIEEQSFYVQLKEFMNDPQSNNSMVESVEMHSTQELINILGNSQDHPDGVQEICETVNLTNSNLVYDHENSTSQSMICINEVMDCIEDKGSLSISNCESPKQEQIFHNSSQEYSIFDSPSSPVENMENVELDCNQPLNLITHSDKRFQAHYQYTLRSLDEEVSSEPLDLTLPSVKNYSSNKSEKLTNLSMSEDHNAAQSLPSCAFDFNQDDNVKQSLLPRIKKKLFTDENDKTLVNEERPSISDDVDFGVYKLPNRGIEQELNESNSIETDQTNELSLEPKEGQTIDFQVKREPLETDDLVEIKEELFISYPGETERQSSQFCFNADTSEKNIYPDEMENESQTTSEFANDNNCYLNLYQNSVLSIGCLKIQQLSPDSYLYLCYFGDCRYESMDLSEFQYHLVGCHWLNYDWQCFLCAGDQKRVRTVTSLLNHMLLHLQSDNLLEPAEDLLIYKPNLVFMGCEDTSQVFINNMQLCFKYYSLDMPVVPKQSKEDMKSTSDFRVVTVMKPYSCFYSGCIFSTHSTDMFINHLWSHPIGVLKCFVCKAFFFNTELYFKHLLLHDIGKYHCAHCYCCFVDEHVAVVHSLSCHQNLTPRLILRDMYELQKDKFSRYFNHVVMVKVGSEELTEIDLDSVICTIEMPGEVKTENDCLKTIKDECHVDFNHDNPSTSVEETAPGSSMLNIVNDKPKCCSDGKTFHVFEVKSVKDDMDIYEVFHSC